MNFLILCAFLFCNGLFYYLGQRAGLRETEKEIRHFAEVLLKQSADIEKMRLLGENGTAEFYIAKVDDIDEFLNEHRN